MMKLSYYLLDVFSSHQFGGNPLAVFPDADQVSTALMQKIASELNLSETTFIQQPTSAESDCTVRIFTPRSEVPMAGHPTIGTAWTILRHALLQPRRPDTLVFDEGVGPIEVGFEMRDSLPHGVVMHQPLPEFGQVIDRELSAQILSLSTDELLENCPAQFVSCGLPILIVPLRSLDAVGRAVLRPDVMEQGLSDVECREVFVFSCETTRPSTNVHCRFFAPRFGVPEDPATGGAHGPLGSYLVKYGLSDGKRIQSEQGIEMGRPSEITVRIEHEAGNINKVQVAGDCAEVGAGQIFVNE